MKLYLGITDTTKDTFLNQQIALISDTIEAYCSRKFASTQYIQTFYREELEDLGLTVNEVVCYHFPLISVDNIITKQLDTDVGEAVTDYRIHKPSAKIIKKRFLTSYTLPLFYYGNNILEVTYTAGYATIPATVTQVVYDLVKERFNKMTNGIDLNFGSDVQSIAIPGVINIQYDFKLQNNKRDSAFGVILGNSANVLDFYRSERAVVGSLRLAYVE
jgi:hypothetical protein